LVVKNGMGAYGVFLAGVVSSSLGVLLVVPQILRSLRRGASRLAELASFGVPTMPSGFASMLLQVADRPILTLMTTPVIVGLYNANYRLAIPMMLCVSVFEYAWKPFYLNHADDDDAPVLFGKVFTYFSFACAVVFLIISMFAAAVVRLPFPGGTLIHPSYWQGLHIVPIVAAAYYFAGVTSNLAAGLHITKNTKRLPLIVGSAAAANILLNLVLIPSLSYTGAAWATLGAYAVSACLMFLASQRVYAVRYEWSRVLRIVLLAASVFAVDASVSAPTTAMRLAVKGILLAAFLLSLRLVGVIATSDGTTLRSFLRRSRVG
ncbi:MAG: polysaccharide biosynthesis C-terminal domain-containing protein, partial [Candidatus Kapaibacterium sp.]